MKVDCADRAQDLPKRDRQHPAAGGQDVVRELGLFGKLLIGARSTADYRQLNRTG
jgi:hypothetical protein